ncbi:MAG TPA: hypothetical protein PKC36_08165 [Dietzia sp.]|nr:hypothetical protein [Dietzia sp.]
MNPADQEALLERAVSLCNTAAKLEKAGKYDSARGLLFEARSLFGTLGQAQHLSWCENLLGNIAMSLHQAQIAQGHFENALELVDYSSDPVWPVVLKAKAGSAARMNGDLDAALSYLSTARSEFASLALVNYQEPCEFELAEIYQSLGQSHRAVNHFCEAARLNGGLDNPDKVGDCYFLAANAAYQGGDKSTAEKLYIKTIDVYRGSGNGLNIGKCSNNLGNIYSEKGEHRRALDAYGIARDEYRRHSQPTEVALAANAMGIEAGSLGEFERAAELHDEAFWVFQALNSPEMQAMCLLNKGNARAQQERYEDACGLYAQARRFYADLRHAKGVSWCESGIKFCQARM